MIFESDKKKEEQDTIRLDFLEPGRFFVESEVDPKTPHYVSVKVDGRDAVTFFRDGRFSVSSYASQKDHYVIDLGPAVRIETMYDVDSKLERLAAKKYREEQERKRAQEEKEDG